MKKLKKNNKTIKNYKVFFSNILMDSFEHKYLKSYKSFKVHTDFVNNIYIYIYTRHIKAIEKGASGSLTLLFFICTHVCVYIYIYIYIYILLIKSI